MTESVTPINVSTDAWVDLVDRVNEIIEKFANNVVSTGGAVNGSVTVNGSFYASTVYSGGQLVVKQDRTVSAGTGLTGGGSLANNITISLNANTIALLNKANTALQVSDFTGKIGLQNSVAIAQIDATGTANSSTYLAGDGSWKEVEGGTGDAVLTVNGVAPDEFGDVAIEANNIPFSPSGNLSSIEIQGAITELEGEKVAVADLPSTNGILVKTGNTSFVSRNLVTANASFITIANANGANGDISVSLSANTISSLALANTSIQPNGAQTLNSKTLVSPTITGTIKEDVYTISDGASVVLDPDNGSIQVWTLGANRTPTANTTSWTDGKSMTLMVDDGEAYTIDWGSLGITLNWVGGSAPTLTTTDWNVIEIWKAGSSLRAVYVGAVA